MDIGVSTASLFVRKTTEDALGYLCEEHIPVTEVFLSTYREYNGEFGKVLRSRMSGKTKVHSFHTLTTQFEPQLYSVNPRAAEDSFEMLVGALDAAREIGAFFPAASSTSRASFDISESPASLTATASTYPVRFAVPA